jgi:hypothetical protein
MFGALYLENLLIHLLPLLLREDVAVPAAANRHTSTAQLRRLRIAFAANLERVRVLVEVALNGLRLHAVREQHALREAAVVDLRLRLILSLGLVGVLEVGGDRHRLAGLVTECADGEEVAFYVHLEQRMFVIYLQINPMLKGCLTNTLSRSLP